ncbi:hypothetical protein CPG37_05065 [Malaciobacter canalis]|uniref:Schlafen group 3-like DNA/RNA helicase domain-containing protein n=1 Tax=Malaciobacter canalis TaxID=1912871 RepID=A0ABX4LRQ5_9BACT|nr:DUF2075 domain-containing protein [Malaciobacter canalis]PHO10423.1 hypothetical protein CPG37_05065 [Malaciobacter canalis]QEE32529.1 DUF2075 domain-containing protein [Malaciobacter canalis]
MQRSYYSNTISKFIKEDTNKILGELARYHNHALENLQKNAWIKQIELLKQAFYIYTSGHIFFEFAIPRMGKRVDNIIIVNDSIFVIEFKVGSTTYDNNAIEQVIDYAQDLKNFHEGSHTQKLFPILISTEAKSVENKIEQLQDKLYKPLLTNKNSFLNIIKECLNLGEEHIICPLSWKDSIYKPTPTIIEAAQALYKGHNVQEISRSDSGAINLSITTDKINQIINSSKETNKKSICFITGVPGAGKTLAGLNIANERMNIDEKEHAVFLSGNGPLVDVLREALTRDEVNNAKMRGKKLTKKEAAIKTHAFIQNIHHFRDDSLVTNKAPIEKVIVFDEAQRAWNQEQTSSFMKRKKGQDDFESSEPRFLIDVMNRHQGWCTIICLIGGGQEINTGEAGLEEWISSLKNHFQDWNIYLSNSIVEDKNYLRDNTLKDWLNESANIDKNLHLSVSVRSFRSEKLSDFIHSILDIDRTKATSLYNNFLKNDYPILVTRDFEKAKKWLNSKAIGSERSGVVASSGAYRLRPFGINVKNQIDAPIWFLNNKDDIRSSYFNEEVATEFDIQGLELDWTCVCWDGDFYFHNNQWMFRKFKGTKWQNINKDIIKNYLLNAYRVLLTRARQGMIIFIPNGSVDDKTRLSEFYDETFNYIKEIGIQEV